MAEEDEFCYQLPWMKKPVRDVLPPVVYVQATVLPPRDEGTAPRPSTLPGSARPSALPSGNSPIRTLPPPQEVEAYGETVRSSAAPQPRTSHARQLGAGTEPGAMARHSLRTRGHESYRPQPYIPPGVCIKARG